MNNRERALACLNYESYDHLPVVHFGFWHETLLAWRDQGHLTDADLADGGAKAAREKMGFDFEWGACCGVQTFLKPGFETKVIKELPDGSKQIQNGNGVIVLARDGATSIPAEIDHLLKDRATWEEHYKPRLQFSDDRVPTLDPAAIAQIDAMPRGISCGSLFGYIRDWAGVTGTAYIYADDEELFDEMIDTLGNLTVACVEKALAQGARFDFGHFWEDICFKNGPLIIPDVFQEKVGPYYKRITDLLKANGAHLCSLDCDGKIDALIPTWIENGVNTMFPIEVGTWNASIAPWREEYGREMRGVGGMNKVVFAQDRATIDAEVERLKRLVDLGGFIPCPDHRIPPDAIWDNVLYYTERMRATF
jgi:uroporphyrinogen decarboxylase